MSVKTVLFSIQSQMSRTTSISKCMNNKHSPLYLYRLYSSIGGGGAFLSPLHHQPTTKTALRNIYLTASFSNAINQPLVAAVASENFHNRLYFPARRLFSKNAGKPPSSLADEIMASKIASDKEAAAGDDKQSGGNDAGDNKSDQPKEPMPRWQKYSYLFLGVLMGGSLLGNAVLFSLPDKDEQGNNIEDEFSSLPFPSQYYQRLKNKFFATKKSIEEPFSDKLLPDPLEPPYYQPKYTIVLELTGLLVHSNWTHKHGWRFQKRPGLDMFLAQVGFPNFEVVVWTVENGMTFFPIINGMDPQGQYIMYRLFRDATHYINGTHIKDLSRLNRDLRRVIVIDWNKDTLQNHPDNALILKKWDGDNGDRTLIGLAQLLLEVKESGLEDVRDVLTYYRQFEDPIEAFRENQRKLEEELRLEEERKKNEKESSRFSSFSGLSSFSRFRK